MNSWIPDTAVGWASTIGFIITGVFALMTLFNRSQKQKEKETDEVADRLIKTLEATVNALEKKVAEQTISLDANTKAIAEEKGKNHILTEVFQGRDKQTLEFQKQGFAYLAQAPEYFSISKDTNLLVKEMNKNMEKLYTAIEKHLANQEQLMKATTK